MASHPQPESQEFESHIQALKHNILEFCPSEHKAAISEVAFSDLQDFEVNARRTRTEAGTPVVLVHDGLMGFAQDIASIIVADWLRDPFTFLNSDLEEEMSKKATMTCICFLAERPVAQQSRVMPPPPAYAQLATRHTLSLRDGMELFIVSHEVAHIVLHHPDNTLALVELAADEWATGVLQRLRSNRPLGGYVSRTDRYTPMAGLAFLHAQQLLDYVRTNFDAIVEALSLGPGPVKLRYPHDPRDGMTHPPSNERIDNLVCLLRPTLGSPDTLSFMENLPVLFSRLHGHLAALLA